MPDWLTRHIVPTPALGSDAFYVQVCLGKTVLRPTRTREHFAADGHFIDLVVPCATHPTILGDIRAWLSDEQPLACPPHAPPFAMVAIVSVRSVLVPPKTARIAMTLRVMDRVGREWPCS